MIQDNIFNAFATAEAIWPEIERLVAAVPAAFTPAFEAALTQQEELNNVDWASSHVGYHFSLRRLQPRQRGSAQLLFVFDLTRPELPLTWRHGRQALLTCAYSPSVTDGWAVAQATIGMNGRLNVADTLDEHGRHFDGRLLAWQGNGWRNSSWLFSVPLLSIDSHEALRREIVSPVLALLNEADEASPFDGGSAVEFS